MVNLVGYPYPTYTPNRVAAGSVAAIVGVSLAAWFIQSCQARFRPPRLSILLLLSHLSIFIELTIRATVSPEQQSSKTIFTVVNSLFAVGQRMVIVGNFSFVMEIHHTKPRLSRVILLGAALCVVSSGILMAPTNTLSFDPDRINLSFIFRELSVSILFLVTVLFYPVWYWSKTMKDMKRQAITLMIISSSLCLILAIFNLIQSLSDYYTKINSHEGWFYAFQMTPIILAHFTWSIFHPKRTLNSPTTIVSKPPDEEVTAIAI